MVIGFESKERSYNTCESVRHKCGHTNYSYGIPTYFCLLFWMKWIMVRCGHMNVNMIKWCVHSQIHLWLPILDKIFEKVYLFFSDNGHFKRCFLFPFSTFLFFSVINYKRFLNFYVILCSWNCKICCYFSSKMILEDIFINIFCFTRAI